MPLTRIRVDGLRILTGVDCALHPERNYFFGPNGAGKTSLLEGVYLLGRGRSFRTRQTRKLVQRGRDALAVFGELQRDGEVRRVGVGIDGSGLDLRVDRRPAAGAAELAALLRVDVIDPSVHGLIEAGPSERRRFLDWGVFHVEPEYLNAWKRYRRLLGQRNAALKAGADADVLGALNAPLVEAGAAVDRARSEYSERIGAAAAAVGARLLGQPLEIGYRRGWRSGVGLAEALGESAERDRAAGYTHSGPHRADLRVTVGGTPVAEIASRGQQKLAAAALVVAQLSDAALRGRPDAVLLIDDPAAELDSGSLGRLLDEVQALPCQLILTGLAPELLPVDRRFPVFHVEQGRIERWYNELI